MKFSYAATLALAPLVAFAVSSGPVAAQSGDLERVTQHLRGVSSMTANFSQTDRKNKTLTGTLTMKRPGKIRFQYQQGVPLLLVADGKALTFIDYQVNQVQRWPIGDSPLSVLLDPNANMAKFAKVVASGDANIVLVQAKDPKKPQYGVITLAFTRNASAPSGLMLQGWVATDSQNNRTRVSLSNQRFNVAVSDQAFKYKDPRPANRR